MIKFCIARSKNSLAPEERQKLHCNLAPQDVALAKWADGKIVPHVVRKLINILILIAFSSSFGTILPISSPNF